MAQKPQQAQQQKPQNTALARQRQATTALATLIESKRDAFALVAGKFFDATRLVKLAQGALARNPALAECTPPSVLVALMRCAELGLEPDAALPQRRMWLIPRNNRRLGAKECTYIIDYRAQLQLARDTGLVTSIVAEVVYEKDVFEYEQSPAGDSIVQFRFKPDPFADDRGKIRGFFAAARLQGGEVHFTAMSMKQMLDHKAQHAPSYDGRVTGPWQDFPAAADKPGNPAMGVKTVLRRLFNLLPAGQNEAAMRLQATIASEAEIEEGRKTVTQTAPVELDLGVAEIETTPTTADEVERTLAGAKGAAAKADETLEPGQDPKAMQREPGEEG